MKIVHIIRIPLLSFSLFLFSLLIANQVHAAVALDPTFGNGGISLTSFSQGNAFLGEMVLQPDDKAVVAGPVFNGSNYDWGIVRYNTDGTLDPTFGNGGKITKDFGGADSLNTVAMQPDGKIVVGGYTQGTCSSSGTCWTLARYNTDGTLDQNFGNGGYIFPETEGGEIKKIKVQTDGKIVVAGGGGSGLVLIRYNPDGSIDSTFGKINTNIGMQPNGLVIQQDGKIVVSGNGGVYYVYVIRFNTDGSLDNTFANSGIFTSFITWGDQISEGNIALQTDGKIVIVGTQYVLPPVFPGNVSSSFLGRLNTNGSFDSSFGNGNFVIYSFSGAATTYSGMVLPDGKILIEGNDQSIGSSNDEFAIRRFNSDGTPDTTFGDNGSFVTFAGSDGNSSLFSFALQQDGKLVAAGSALDGGIYDFALARYTGVVNPSCPWSGVLQPINSDGSSIFKQKSTVSVKLQLTGSCSSQPDATITLYVAKITDNVVGTVMEAESNSQADTGNVFHYDVTNNQYLFNLGTKTLTTGTYQLSMYYGGTNITGSLLGTVNVSLR